MKNILNNIVSIIVAVTLVLGIINFDPAIPLPRTGPIVIEGITHLGLNQMGFSSQETIEDLRKKFEQKGESLDDYIVIEVRTEIDEKMGFCETVDIGVALPKTQIITTQSRSFHLGSFKIEYGAPETFIKNEGGYIVTVWTESEGLSEPDEFGMSKCINRTNRVSLAKR